MTEAKAAAGTRNVTVIGGASTFQQCLRERLCDEVQIKNVQKKSGAKFLVSGPAGKFSGRHQPRR